MFRSWASHSGNHSGKIRSLGSNTCCQAEQAGERLPPSSLGLAVLPGGRTRRRELRCLPLERAIKPVRVDLNLIASTILFPSIPKRTSGGYAFRIPCIVVALSLALQLLQNRNASTTTFGNS